MSIIKSSQTRALLELKNSRDFGYELIKAFHESNKRNSSYRLTLDQLIIMIETRGVNQKRFLSTLGGSVLNSGTSKNSAISAMVELGRKSNGKIPSTNADFIAAIVKKVTDFKFIDAVVYTASETTKDVIGGVQSVGDTLLNTGKILKFMFPVAVVWFLYMYLKKRTA